MGAANLRLLLKNNGYKYDGFLKTWINIDREKLLHKMANDILNKKKTIEEYADFYRIPKDFLTNHLIKLGYDFVEINSIVNISNTVSENFDNNNIETKEINPKDKEPKNKEFEEKIPFTIEEIALLKELLTDWKNEKLSITNETKKINFYLSKNIITKLDDFAEQNNMSKSSIVDQALKKFFK
jgi:hypothetical protein